MSVEIEIDDEEFQTMIGREIELVEQVNQKLLPIFAYDVIATARSNLQTNSSVYSGDLNASINILEQDDNSILVGTTKFYAGWVERGRGPVKAIHAKVLHFFTKDGKEVFTKFVGPSPPRPYFEPALIEATKRFLTTLRDYLEQE